MHFLSQNIYDDDVENDGDVRHLVHPLSDAPQQAGGDADSAQAHVLVQTSTLSYISLSIFFL